jgi:hypothetical protein
MKLLCDEACRPGWFHYQATCSILVSTDSDFERLLQQFPGARVVILRSCDYPAEIAADLKSARRDSSRYHCR